VILTHIRRAAVLACLTAVSITFAATGASADDGPSNSNKPTAYEQDPLDMEYDPALSDDALITDNAEAQIVLGSSQVCSYESVQSTPNAAPASGSFQLMYVVPSDINANAAMDVPASCNDGDIHYSALARSSRNMATWLARQNVNMNYRTLNIAYTHNYTGASYPTRGVRRFKSASTRATWESLAMYKSDGTSPRNAKLRKDLGDAGFKAANTKYMAMLSTYGSPTSTGSTYVGIAEQGGSYGMTVRFSKSSTGSLVTIRYGCAVDGDAFMAHEASHLLGAGHVTDNANDLMKASKPRANFNTSPALVWDYQRNNYDSIVRNSGYVASGNLTGNYYTC
jgi:hypothetical protein